jgi:putative membrane protein
LLGRSASEAVTSPLNQTGSKWRSSAGASARPRIRTIRRARFDKLGGVGDGDNVPEVEPDYRFTLANERTFLAWQRTALGLLAAAVAVVQLVPELSIAGARHVLGILLALLAILTAGMGILRWRQVDRAMRRDLPLPRHPTPIYLGIGLVLIGLLTLGLVVVKAVTG